ncbi:MAG: hypothetical protein WC372_10390 [Candidatus Neomarinimicrobiota bacterium]|jgi:hypothetical protein
MTKEEVLQSLFYDLLRDAAPAGYIEHAMRELETLCHGRLPPDKVEYSNKHLAGYALELGQRTLKALEHSSKGGDDGG